MRILVLMIVFDADTVTFTDLSLHAYEQALEPKRLALLAGEHFTPYVGTFAQASGAARESFLTHLLQTSKTRAYASEVPTFLSRQRREEMMTREIFIV